MNKYKSILLACAATFVVSSCDLNLQENPNALTPTQANPDFLLNNIQLEFATFFNRATFFGMENTRMVYMFGQNYENAYQATAFDNLWTGAYAGLLTDVDVLIPLAEERELFVHAGMAKVMKAYVLMTLVDYFGDIPYSEALDPNIFNPKADNGQAVYAAAMALLDEAIADFGKTSLGGAPDLYYLSGNRAAKWTSLAKTLKLRGYLQTRLVDSGAAAQINALLSENDLVDTDAENFMFSYGTNNDNPDTRHPLFTNNYLAGGNDYMSNYFMWALYQEKGLIDPRIRYYLYRQSLTVPDGSNANDVNELPCISTQRPQHYPDFMPYCTIGDGYWGRDHLDDDGIPPDGTLRTLFGVYPAGGKYDNNAGAPGSADSGAKGAGIQPILMSSFTEFMKAEAALLMGTTGDARAYLESGVRKSIATVMAFGASKDAAPATMIPSETVINNYVTAVLNRYDAASDNDGKMEVIAREYWIALFGNGVDAYNTYRRTGKPSNLQPGLQTSFGAFYRSFTYPSAFVNRNSSVSQKPNNSVQVFWDTNPAGFID